MPGPNGGPWTQSKEVVHGPGVQVLSSPLWKGGFATFSFTFNEKLWPQTKDSFLSAYVNVLFRIFAGIFVNTEDLLVTNLVFLGTGFMASHALMVERVIKIILWTKNSLQTIRKPFPNPFQISERSTKGSKWQFSNS